jgi:transcriptional regulator with XRE-family HTH domain
MAGHTPWREIEKNLQKRPGFEERVAAHRNADVREIEIYQRRLEDVRRALNLTQAAVAARLGVGQTQVSRIENQHDLYLSTLRNYIRALGGELEIVATFGDERLEMTLGELAALAATSGAPAEESVELEPVAA